MNHNPSLTLAQKLIIGAVVGALIGVVSAFAQDRLSGHYIKLNGKRKG
jgi:ABC-type branched-subunit amino acid transport system permease subunit